jgi:hypothetical protein
MVPDEDFIVYDLAKGKYSIDGIEWIEIDVDHL